MFYLQNVGRDQQRAALAAETGRRLRALRQAQGLSVSKLAAASALGKGTLSELETGRRNPTLQTLFAVTTALGVPLSAALPPGEAAADTTPPIIAGEAIDATLIDRFVDVTTVTELYRTTITAGRRQRSAPHAPGVTEHWIVYAGHVQLGPNGAPESLNPGDSTSFRGDVSHFYHAQPGEDVAATLVVRYPQ